MNVDSSTVVIHWRKSMKKFLLTVAIIAILITGALVGTSETTQASWVAFSCYKYDATYDSNGKHWYAECNVNPLKAHQWSWNAMGPRGNCDDPNIKSAYVFGKPYCSAKTFGAVNGVSQDNLVRVGISLPDQVYPGWIYGAASNFTAYP